MIVLGCIEVERIDVERSEDYGNVIYGVYVIVNGVLVFLKYLLSLDLVFFLLFEILYLINGMYVESGLLWFKDVIES